jgi:hypothetical protein
MKPIVPFFLCSFSLVLAGCLVPSNAAAFQAESQSKPVLQDKSDDPREAQAGEEWLQLFNGKDLTGWKAKIVGHKLGDNYADTFRVVDGLLTVSYDKYKAEDFEGGFKKFGHLFYQDKFSNYLLRIEYRFIGDQCPNGPGWAWRNSGVMLHGQNPETMEVNQNFPVSIEAQFLGGDGQKPRSTLNLCTPGTNVVLKEKLFLPHCTTSNSPTFHGDQWVTADMEVRGNGIIRHIINGQVVMEYSKAQYDERDADAKKLIKEGNLMISEGTISLQSESHGIQFRKIELKQLEEPAAQ